MARVRGSEPVDPRRTALSTPAETSRLLQLIWTDEAGPPEACAEARRLLALQMWPNRLRAGFPDSVAVAAKTGTLRTGATKQGVVTFPDGMRYAVAVFLESEAGTFVDPHTDQAIGRLASAAVEGLPTAPSTDRPGG